MVRSQRAYRLRLETPYTHLQRKFIRFSATIKDMGFSAFNGLLEQQHRLQAKFVPPWPQSPSNLRIRAPCKELLRIKNPVQALPHMLLHLHHAQFSSRNNKYLLIPGFSENRDGTRTVCQPSCLIPQHLNQRGPLKHSDKKQHTGKS